VKRSETKFYLNDWKISVARRVQRSTNVLDALTLSVALHSAMQRKGGAHARRRNSISKKERMPQKENRRACARRLV